MPKKDHRLVELNRHTTSNDETISQIDRFKALARELGCDEDEAAFDATLRRIAETKALPKYEPKKRAPKPG